MKIWGKNRIFVGVLVALFVLNGLWQITEPLAGADEVSVSQKMPVVEMQNEVSQSTSELERVTPPNRKEENDATKSRKLVPKSPRKFVAPHVTPTFLAGLAEEERSIYLGKWIIASGPIGDIDLISGRYAQVQFIRLIKPTLEKPFIYMIFDNKWIDDLAVIPKKQNISVLGQISILLKNRMTLTNCEIIDDANAGAK